MGDGSAMRGDGVSPSSSWCYERDSSHTTGIHRISVDQKKRENVQKKLVNVFQNIFVDSESLQKVEHFFQLWDKRAIPK